MKKITYLILLLGLVGCRLEQAGEAGDCVFEYDFDPCDGRDNNCDGTMDEDCPTEEGESEAEAESESESEAEAESESESEPLPPCKPGADADCDGDGFMAANGDCDDFDDRVSPEALEDNEHENVADGQDNDCDGVSDEWGYGLDSDYDMVPDSEDCDPNDFRRWTGQPEICGDGVDSDCNGDDNTTEEDGCEESVGIIDGLVIDLTSLRLIVSGVISDGLETSPIGDITAMEIGREVDNWGPSFWSAPWTGEDALYELGPFPRADSYWGPGAFTVRVRSADDELIEVDLRFWRPTGDLRRVPRRSGRGGMVLIAP